MYLVLRAILCGRFLRAFSEGKERIVGANAVQCNVARGMLKNKLRRVVERACVCCEHDGGMFYGGEGVIFILVCF